MPNLVSKKDADLKIMENRLLEVGYGVGKGEDALALGIEVTRKALAGIKKYSLSALLVFASVHYQLEELLAGINGVAGNAPVLGATTAGEICNGPHWQSVVAVALASPYLRVRVGIGKGVSRNWLQAVHQAVSAPDISPFFSIPDSPIWSELTLQGKSAFGLLFSPGNTKSADSRSFEILEELKRLSQGRLPIIGAGSADDWRMEKNYILWGRQALPDSVMIAVFETRLRYGIALAHGFYPTLKKATVTRSLSHEVLELDGKPAGEVYCQLQGSAREVLEGKHLTLTTKRPVGLPDPYGQFSINVASYFTGSGGLRFSQPVEEGTVLTIMEADPDNLIAAGQEAFRKALLRGSITDPALVLVFSCALRARILEERIGEEIQAIGNIIPEVPIAGFYSFGEQGQADDGVNRHNNEVITMLALGRELSYGAQVAIENDRLRSELEQTAALKAAYEALQRQIKERQQAEQALKKSEEKFRLLVEQMPAVTFMIALDAARSIIYVSPQVEAILGVSPEEYRTDPEIWTNQVHSDDRDRLLQEITRLAATGEPLLTELRMQARSGREVWFRAQAILVRDANREPLFLQGVMIDITERKEAEEVRSRLAAIVESSEDAIIGKTLEGEITNWNSGATKIYGYAADEVIGQPISILTPPDRPDEVAKFLKKIKSGEKIAHYETVRLRKDGQRIHISLSISPIKDASGRIVGVSSIARDITSHQQAEEALGQSEAKYRALVETTHTGYVIIDSQGMVLDANPEYVRLTGHQRLEEIFGRNVLQWTAPHDRERNIAEVGKCAARGFVRNLEVDYLSRNGRTVPVEINATVLQTADGTRILTLIRDITERKQTEEALRQIEEQLRQAQKMEAVGRLAGGIAHDFNNMLSAIGGYSDLLLLDLQDDDPRCQDVEEIKRAADRAASLTRQLLAFSRKQIFQPKNLDLNEVVDNLGKMLRRLMGEEIELATLGSPGLGRVMADPGQIEQVILNLVLNSKDSMPQGGKLTIETANVDLDESYTRQHLEVQPGPYVMLAVSDTGLGMDEETESHIFEPFFTTKEQGQGTGLGLSMIYGIVKQSGGHIWVYSEPGQGTTFKIYLPRVDQPREAAALPPVSAAAGPGAAKTILLVEDEEVVRQVARKILERNGYTILEADSGRAALRVSKEHPSPIHLLLTDVLMPKMGGRELVDRLTPQRPEMKVLFMSGHTENAIVHHGVLDEGIAFIQKPFRYEALLSKVSELLVGSPKRP